MSQRVLELWKCDKCGDEADRYTEHRGEPVKDGWIAISLVNRNTNAFHLCRVCQGAFFASVGLVQR